MKATRTTILALLAVLLASCNSQQKTIGDAAYGYLDAVANYRFDDAYPYASQRTQDVTLRFFKDILTRTDTAYINKNTPAKVTIDQVIVTSDSTAQVVYSKTTPITRQQHDTVDMVREESRWVVEWVIQDIPAILRPVKAQGHRFTREEVMKMEKHTLPEKSNAE